MAKSCRWLSWGHHWQGPRVLPVAWQRRWPSSGGAAAPRRTPTLPFHRLLLPHLCVTGLYLTSALSGLICPGKKAQTSQCHSSRVAVALLREIKLIAYSCVACELLVPGGTWACVEHLLYNPTLLWTQANSSECICAFCVKTLRLSPQAVQYFFRVKYLCRKIQ